MRLTLEKAKELLEHAREAAKDDGFIRHCICVGDTAAVIAEAIGLEEPDYARALGYVHDIGKHLNEDNVEWHDVLLMGTIDARREVSPKSIRCAARS